MVYRPLSLLRRNFRRRCNCPFYFLWSAPQAVNRLSFSSPFSSMKPTANGTLEDVSTFENFDLVKHFRLDFTDVEVSRWRSRVTGLSVVHLNYEAPIVNGYFAVGTEIFNDSGCPHTLEHLVFMGSEKYPYKGIIDHLANRAFSNGTNAWTDVDHTVYTVSTAGGQGFLQLLPYYVDHVLYPTLTQSSFLTEVHHIDDKGRDSGVVYSEMQGRQNTSGDLMSLQLQRAMNKKDSAYRSETGGLMEALRTLTIEQIRDYHSKYYVPHNLSLIVAGSLKGGSKALLSVIQEKVEPSLIAHGQNSSPRPTGWKRPFLETPSADRQPLPQSTESIVLFPEKDESLGELIIGYRGPKPDDFLERRALDILGTYLTSSSVAPLNKEFIEIEQPLCSYIYFGEDVRATMVDLPVYVGSVPVENLENFKSMLEKSLERIAERGLDMPRMQMIIKREKRQLQSKLESAKGDIFSTSIITDFLYGPGDGSGMQPALDDISGYDVLEQWTSEQWVSLLKRYYLDAPAVVIQGKPSADLANSLDVDEKARIAAQTEKLGPEGIAKAAKALEAAKAEHDRPIPEEILKSFPVPDVHNISWISVQSVQDGPTLHRQLPVSSDSRSLRKHLEQDSSPTSFFVQYDHVHSEFVAVQAFLSLKNLDDSLRPLMSAYMSSFFTLPVRRASDHLMSHEEVVNALDEQTVSYDAGLGVSSYFPELLRISIKVHTDMYEEAVRWLRDLLYSSIFDKERLLITLAKIQQSLPEMKRDGNTVMTSASSELLYGQKSTLRANSLLYQSDQVPQLIKRLQENFEGVVADLKDIRKTIIDPSQIRFSVSGNVMALKRPRSIWKECFPSFDTSVLQSAPMSITTLSEIGQNPSRKAVIIGLPTIESSFTIHTARGIYGFDHPDYPAQRVACEILNATESFLWRYIRGSGLAYGASVSLDVEAGLTNFSLYRSSDSIKAFQEAAKVVRGLTDGSIPLTDTIVDTAKSSIVYSVTRGVSTASRAAVASFVNQALKSVNQDHNVKLLERFQAVTKDDIIAALKKSFLPIFDSSTSVAVIVTAPNRTERTANELITLGFEVENRDLQADFDQDADMEDTESASEEGSESSGHS